MVELARRCCGRENLIFILDEVGQNVCRHFITMFFPTAATEIDFTRGVEWLDKELSQIVQDAELGRRLADKLLKVWNCNSPKRSTGSRSN